MKRLANGTRTSTTYDAADRTIWVFNDKSDGSAVSSFHYSYDAGGRRTRVVEADGDTVTWTYDQADQLLLESRNGPTAVVVYNNTFTYDYAGNRLRQYADGALTMYDYDHANRLQVA